MKCIAGIFAFILLATWSWAQPVYKNQLGQLLNIVPYQIQVSDQATTILVFPYEVKEADMGVGELLATKIPDVKNILKLKAERSTLDTTSLYVITGDGKVHVFEVTYTSKPYPLAYELSFDGNLKTIQSSAITFDQQPFSQSDLTQWVNYVRGRTGTMHKMVKAGKIKLRINDIYTIDKFLFLKFNLSNQSTLPYIAGWSQMYIQDRRTRKRSAVQDIAIHPIYSDSMQEIPGIGSASLIVGIPRQTLPRSKRMIFEVHEDNGGRNIRFKIPNRLLLQAKPL